MCVSTVVFDEGVVGDVTCATAVCLATKTKSNSRSSSRSILNRKLGFADSGSCMYDIGVSSPASRRAVTRVAGIPFGVS